MGRIWVTGGAKRRLQKMNVELPAALLELPWILTQPRFRLPHPHHSHRSPGILVTLLGYWSLLLCSWAVEKAPSLTPLVDSFPHSVYSQVSVFLLVAMLSQHYPLRSGHPDLPCLKLLRKHPSQIRVGWSPATSCPTRNIAHGWK